MLSANPPGARHGGVTPDDILRAAALLRAGKLVAFPTETVYGLGADATAPEAVAGIYAAKGRPQFNPLIAHVASQAAAEAEGIFTGDATRLAAAFWPGPLTLVLPRHASGTACDLACAGLPSVGLRVPSHPVALALLEAAGRPIAAPSANRSGHISPTDASHVSGDLGDAVDLILDGGPSQVGVESTILACLDGVVTLLRPGGLSVADIEALLGRPLDKAVAAGIQAPGMLASHYAPNAAMRLDATSLKAGEIGLDFAATFGDGSLDLSPTGDTREAAANLYRYLRALDARNPVTIAVAPIPQSGLGAAIIDRLQRAAAPRG
ncbi:L-threonylcarbamoyladenylate synthase [Beijerinckia sp. L45]|uniref:L-threonylcarbamoyladenylate synthase n=1 Tax=Beijerinckia sp. L45 TaxID=1641855 RepID=UPI00131C418A|nr:L-threonylcarbamoyladenylate synthase [Beijerinckia sp. L45]